MNNNILAFPELLDECPFCGQTGTVKEREECCDEAAAGGLSEED